MSNTINIDDFLSEDEKKEIAVRVFTGKLESISQAEIERIVSNNAYAIAQELVDKNFGDEYKESIKTKLPKIIDGLSSYTVFDRGDSYGAFRKEATIAWKTVEDTVKANHGSIEARVINILENIDETTLREKISEAVYIAVTEPLKKKGQ